MTVTIFGKPLDALELQDLQHFLESADDEPLLWEAKGTELDAKEVRRQVCAFANSHDGGYLILGARKVSSSWELSGVAFPDEPALWASNVVGDLEVGVRPRPDFSVESWPVASGHVAVIHVTPTPTPPCLANGTVYERLPGKTQTVRDPIRLSELFRRGDGARHETERRSSAAAQALIDAWDVTEHGNRPRFAIAVAATGNPPNISGRLFRHDFERHVVSRLAHEQPHLPSPLLREPGFPEFSQEAIRFQHTVMAGTGGEEYRGAVRAAWDGTVAVGQLLGYEADVPSAVVHQRVAPCWRLAEQLVSRLEGFGDRYISLIAAGRSLLSGPTNQQVELRRGPLLQGTDEQQVESLSRELTRAAGYAEYEPDASPISLGPATAARPERARDFP